VGECLPYETLGVPAGAPQAPRRVIQPVDVLAQYGSAEGGHAGTKSLSAGVPGFAGVMAVAPL